MILCLNEDWVGVLLGLLSARFGLDPDFTGYENIFLRGVFLGMSRSPHLQQGGAAQARNGWHVGDVDEGLHAYKRTK
jgi:hypothetical protein